MIGNHSQSWVVYDVVIPTFSHSTMHGYILVYGFATFPHQDVRAVVRNNLRRFFHLVDLLMDDLPSGNLT